MVIDVVSLLHANNLLVFFLVLGLGYLVGNLNWRGFEVGATSGVLLAGLFFGHFGFQVPHAVQEVGFVLFIYSVGLQAGPRFFSVFAQDGLKYLAMTSTPSLNVITQAAKSPIPALGYAGTYTFANVFLALAGTVLVYL